MKLDYGDGRGAADGVGCSPGPEECARRERDDKNVAVHGKQARFLDSLQSRSRSEACLRRTEDKDGTIDHPVETVEREY